MIAIFCHCSGSVQDRICGDEAAALSGCHLVWIVCHRVLRGGFLFSELRRLRAAGSEATEWRRGAGEAQRRRPDALAIRDSFQANAALEPHLYQMERSDRRTRALRRRSRCRKSRLVLRARLPGKPAAIVNERASTEPRRPTLWP